MSKAGEELQGARGHPSPQVPISARVAPSQGLLLTLLQLAGGWTRGQHRSRSFVTITVIAITTITMSGLLGALLQSLLALALALGALRRLPPVPVVAVADVAVVHLHLDARGNYRGARKAVGTCGNTRG